MGTLMIRCPVSGAEIPTGMQADRLKFGSVPVFFARTFCPVCRTHHEWFAKEAWVCDEAPPANARERFFAGNRPGGRLPLS